MKVYESALTLETDAITFNLALVLLGLDKSHSQLSTRHFDTATPTGDPVELWVEWGDGGLKQRVPAERLLFDKNAAQAVTESKWVYTGSTFVSGGRYLAEMDGVLVGFVHSPAPVIENARGVGVSQYGTIVLNPHPGLTPGMPIVFIVKAL